MIAIKRVLSIICIATILLTFFVGCSNNNTEIDYAQRLNLRLTETGESIIENVGVMSFNEVMEDVNSIKSFKESTTVTTKSGLEATIEVDGKNATIETSRYKINLNGISRLKSRYIPAKKATIIIENNANAPYCQSIYYSVTAKESVIEQAVYMDENKYIHYYSSIEEGELAECSNVYVDKNTSSVSTSLINAIKNCKSKIECDLTVGNHEISYDEDNWYFTSRATVVFVNEQDAIDFANSIDMPDSIEILDDYYVVSTDNLTMPIKKSLVVKDNRFTKLVLDELDDYYYGVVTMDSNNRITTIDYSPNISYY